MNVTLIFRREGQFVKSREIDVRQNKPFDHRILTRCDERDVSVSLYLLETGSAGSTKWNYRFDRQMTLADYRRWRNNPQR
jgi:hypothetical protein